MKKILKYTGLAILLFILICGAMNFSVLRYGFRQLKGQLSIIFDTEDLETIRTSPNTPDSVKVKLELIGEIKKFAIDSLGINPSKNYTTYYEQHGKPILWVITASEPYRLEARKWKFPIVGEFSYKGHFEKKYADEDITALKKEGWDTRLGEVSAWSTLGYLKDPVLSSMLNKDPGELASLIIHELTHGTLFVKNNLEFNENLADFVGDYGALKFLEFKYGKNSKEYIQYNADKNYYQKFSNHIMHGTRKLDSLYATFDGKMQSKLKDSLKFHLINEIITSSDTLGRKRWSKKIPKLNNAYFVAFKTYQAKQNLFEEEFRTKFNSDFKSYMRYLKQKYPSIGL